METYFHCWCNKFIGLIISNDGMNWQRQEQNWKLGGWKLGDWRLGENTTTERGQSYTGSREIWEAATVGVLQEQVFLEIWQNSH